MHCDFAQLQASINPKWICSHSAAREVLDLRSGTHVTVEMSRHAHNYITKIHNAKHYVLDTIHHALQGLASLSSIQEREDLNQSCMRNNTSANSQALDIHKNKESALMYVIENLIEQ